MKRWKKYAALLLALIMCLSMAACGGDEEGCAGHHQKFSH